MLGWGRGLYVLNLLSLTFLLSLHLDRQNVHKDVLCIARSVHAVPRTAPCLRSMITASVMALQEI